MFVLELPNSLDKCPIPWVNFVVDGCRTAPRDSYGDISTAFINTELGLFGARMLDEDSAQCRVEFDDDSGWLAFRLRWS